MEILLDGKLLRLNPAKTVGKGGEADVYGIGSGRAVKIFKTPDHPDYENNPTEIEAARARIAEHQTKLAAFPKGMPGSVVVPASLALDAKTKKVVGYAMPLVPNAEALLRFSERSYREKNAIGDSDVVRLFERLRLAVSGVHNAGAVIGDFNDLNVLVTPKFEPFLIDADSMQFGSYLTRVFTARFVDPIKCDKNTPSIQLAMPHDENSDWYAYAVMLMQSLLFVGPYGGVHAPGGSKTKLKDWERMRKRVTVFDSEVRYPRPARHYSVLPDDLLHAFEEIFVRDRRGEFPASLVSDIRFSKCPVCGKVHARAACPDCAPATPSMTKEVVTAKVEALKVLDTSGRIIYATVQNGRVKYVVHQGDGYYRETGEKVVSGDIDPTLRVRISGKKTVLAKAGTAVALSEDGKADRIACDSFQNKVSSVDGNSRHVFVSQDGFLKRFGDDGLGMEYGETFGEVLPGQTLFWVSDRMGFGFYRAGTLSRAFVFDPEIRSLGNEAKLPAMSGSLLDATVAFSETHFTFLASLDVSGRRVNRAVMFEKSGVLVATAEAESGDGSWLGTIRGKCAAGKQLFSPTDDGIVRTEVSGQGMATTKVFADTSRFVDSETKLLFGNDGIYAVSASRIWRIRAR